MFVNIKRSFKGVNIVSYCFPYSDMNCFHTLFFISLAATGDDDVSEGRCCKLGFLSDVDLFSAKTSKIDYNF